MRSLIIKLGIIALLVGLLVLIRMYEFQFFYDPFMHFFSYAFQSPGDLKYSLEMFFNIFLRYFLNSIFSLGILFVAFRSKGIVKFASLVYILFLLVLLPLFVLLMQSVTPDDYLAAFYVRRFLAHPVLILILLPAFYYYRLTRKEVN